MARAKSKSDVQSTAEHLAIDALGQRLGVKFTAKKLVLADGVQVAVDGIHIGEDTAMVVESWAHVGPAKGAQPKKVQADLLKLALIKSSPPKEFADKQVDAYLLFVDDQAMSVVSGRKWAALAAKQFGVNPIKVSLDGAVIAGIKLAQEDQDLTKDG